jgi:hypothetical protein
MKRFKQKNSLLAASVLSACAVAASVAPSDVKACSCIETATDAASSTATLVGAGAEALASQLYLGFESVGATITGSAGKQTKQLVTSLELMTKTISNEVRNVPVVQEEIERLANSVDPARQASDPCRFTDRAGDMTASGSLASLQADRLNASSSSYNEMTSSYPDQVDRSGRFSVQTFELLKNRPDIEKGGVNIVTGSDKFGALSPDEVQEAATFINLTTNPNPPAQISSVTTQSQINQNVEADLYNMRMTYPQAVQNQLLSYESPIMSAEDGSWLAETLTSMTPYAERMIDEAEDGVSYNDLLKIMATQRLKSPSWLANLANKDQSGALKDLAFTKADAMLLDYETWKQDKNTALLMSQLLSTLNRQERGN